MIEIKDVKETKNEEQDVIDMPVKKSERRKHKNKKSKSKTITISKRTLYLLCATIAVAWVIAGVATFIGLNGGTLFSAFTVTTDEIEEKAKAAMDGCQYALLTLDVQETIADDAVYTYHYTLSSEKDSSKHTYIYLDSQDQSLYQCWDYDEENENYSIFIYDEEHECWVKTSYSYEPVSSNTWEMMSDLSNYTLMDEKQTWVNSDDECYVLEMLGSDDDFTAMYEQIYVRCSDFMPMGIISYGVSDVDYDKVQNGESIGITLDDGTEAEATTETPAYNEYIQIYEIIFANEDQSLFDEPEDYLDELEYIELYGDDVETEESTEETVDEESTETVEEESTETVSE